MKVFIILLMLLSVQLLLHAQSSKDSTANLIYQSNVAEIMALPPIEKIENEITVASKFEESTHEAPAIVSVVSQDEILSYGALYLSDLLEKVVGMYVISTFLYQNAIISVRGDATAQFNTHILILIDGRPVRDAVSGGINFGLYMRFPVDRVEKIEVIRGPGSVLYGSSAYTGVVNIITKKGNAQKRNIIFRYGENHTRQLSTSLSGTWKKWTCEGNLQFFKTDGWRFAAYDEKTNPVFKSFLYYNEGISGDFHVKRNKLNIYLYGHKHNSAAMGSNTITVWDKDSASTAQDRLFCDIGYEHDFSEKWKSTFNLTGNYQALYFMSPAGAPESFAEFISRDFLFEMTNFVKLNSKINLTFGALSNNFTGYIERNNNQRRDGADPWSNGAAFDIRKGKNPNPVVQLPEYFAQAFAAYGQIEYKPFSFLKTVVGAQLNKAPDISIDAVPRLGIVGNYKKFSLKVLYGSAFRAPTQQERGSVAEGILYPNPQILPEKISTLEGQLAFQNQNFEIAFTVFRSAQENLVFRSAAGDSTLSVPYVTPDGRKIFVPKFYNGGKLASQGLEFESKYKIRNTMSLQFSLSSQSAENTLTAQKDPQGMPKFIAKAGVSMYWSPKWSLGVFYSYFGEGGDIKARLKVNPEPTAFHFLTANLRLNVGKIMKKITSNAVWINLYGENLLNQEINYPEFVRRNINSIKGRTGRAVYLSFQVEF